MLLFFFQATISKVLRSIIDLYLFYIYVYSKISVFGKVNILYRDEEVQNLVEFVSVEKNNEIKHNLYFLFYFLLSFRHG